MRVKTRRDIPKPSTIDTVPKATAADVDKALATLVSGAAVMRNMPAYDRSQILRRAASLMLEREKELGRTISSEEGKILAEGVFEAKRRKNGRFSFEYVNANRATFSGEAQPSIRA